MTPLLYLAQRGSAVILAIAAGLHLAAIVYAANSSLTAADILARTRGNFALLFFYVIFAAAVAIHAPIGCRTIFREWTRWRGASLDAAMIGFAMLLFALGVRGALAVYLP
jgi:fumarate reductase subunit C